MWERQAYLKARSVAGDKAAGEATLKELFLVLGARPFTNDDRGPDASHTYAKGWRRKIAKEGTSVYNIKSGKGGQRYRVSRSGHAVGGSPSGLKDTLYDEGAQEACEARDLNAADAVSSKEAYEFFRLLEKASASSSIGRKDSSEIPKRSRPLQTTLALPV